MTISCKTERSLLDHEEFELVSKTHIPAIHDLTRNELEEVRERLRKLRGREFSFVRQKQLEVRGKAEPRGGSFPGTAAHPLRRKQVFAGALKRMNREINRLRKIEAKRALTSSARRALAMRRAGPEFWRPDADFSDVRNQGANANPSKRSRAHISGSRVGSVTKATQRAQAARDSRTP
jgi:hypothetical protein